ncbi:MAG: hypothetical protein WDO71_15105 [Bacteroidota bacterium]
MLRIVTSLSFLYALTIAVLLVYGLLYYRDFVRSAWHRKRFPVVFLIITAACLGFLWINIHAPLKLHTFSNLDHHFIRHDGFSVNGSIEMGRSDTVNFTNNSFSSFVLSKKKGEVAVTSGYSEEPFYLNDGAVYKLASKIYPVAGHSFSCKVDAVSVIVKVIADNSFELSLNGQVFKTEKPIKKGIASWNIFKDENTFINSPYYNNEKLINTLRHLLIIRNDVSRQGAGELNYFISGRLFQFVDKAAYDQQAVHANDLRFTATIPDNSGIAWGIGFLDNNKNQFRLNYAGNDSFSVFNRFPVSYPLAEEKSTDWSQHTVSKFLLSDSKDMLSMPPVFKEGFLFSAFEQDNTLDFAPVLLTYQKEAENKPLQLKAQWLNKSSSFIDSKNDQFLLPARSAGFSWIFSIRNTFNWEFGSGVMTPAMWQGFLFGSLIFFFVLVVFTSLVTPAGKLSWVWQLLSSVSIVLLTTRLFLYWRYKSFPPFEGMDIPSQQQLLSFWNFGIIIFAIIILAVFFGFGFLKYAWSFIRKKASGIMKTSGGKHNNAALRFMKRSVLIYRD